MHVQPLRGDDDDGHNLLLSTLTGDHGVFMAEAEVNKIEDWYDSDIEHYDPENDWQVPLYQSPLFNAHADQWICFQTLTGGLGALFYDSSDQVVWAYFKPARLTMTLLRKLLGNSPSCRNSAPAGS